MYTWAIAIMWSMAYGRIWVAISITLGILLGTGILATYHLAIRRIVVPGAKNPGRRLLKVAIVKYLVVIIGLYFLVRWPRLNVIAFLGGIALTHFALLAKLAGIKFMERRKSG
jgi:hypothetical protein